MAPSRETSVRSDWTGPSNGVPVCFICYVAFFRYSGGSVVKESSGLDPGSGRFCVEFVFIHVVFEASVRESRKMIMVA